MARNSVRQRLAASFPFREVSQPSATNLAFPTVYAETSVPAASSATGSNALSGVSQVLQSTMKEASDAVTENNRQLTALEAAQQQLLASTNQNTAALNENTTSKGSSGSSALSTASTIAGGIFGQGSLLGPIVSGIMSLFGGGSSSPQPVLTPYVAPSPVQLETVINSPTTTGQGNTGQNTTAQNATASAQTVQIQVNAMDSKSFVEHSDEIAEAVRQALLNSHSLGDVIAGI